MTSTPLHNHDDLISTGTPKGALSPHHSDHVIACGTAVLEVHWMTIRH